MRDSERDRHNQVIEASIDGVSDWGRIATEIGGSAIGCGEGVQLRCDSIHHEEDGVIDPRVYLVELSSEGDGVVRDEVGPSAGDLIGIAGISYEDVVALIVGRIPPTTRWPEQVENFMSGKDAPVGLQYVKMSLSVNSSVKNSCVMV